MLPTTLLPVVAVFVKEDVDLSVLLIDFQYTPQVWLPFYTESSQTRTSDVF